jgi:VWFA-related protein
MLLAITVLPMNAQAPSSATTIVTGSQLVLVPVVVREKSGKHAKGLTKQDFVVQENGTERPLSVFEEVTTSTNRVARPAASGEFTNVNSDRAPRRLVIMALDKINTPMLDQNYARYQMAKYLANTLNDNALISLVAVDMGGVKVVHDFTDDSKALLDALANLRSNPAFNDNKREMQSDKFEADLDQTISEFLEVERRATERTNVSQQHLTVNLTLDALQQLARSYAGVPGRKALVWITAGFPFSVSDSGKLVSTPTSDTAENRATTRESLTELLPLYQRTWQALNDANMSVYTVDARGLVASMDMYRASANTSLSNTTQLHQRWMQEDLQFADSQAALRTFAEMTGGKAYLNTNDLTSSFRDAADDGSHYYMLGYYLSSKDMKPGWRNLKVRVARDGLQVRARKGFFVGTKPDDKRHDVELALSSPLQLTELPLIVRWTGQQPLPKSQEVKVGFTVTLKPESITIDAGNGNHMGFEAVTVVLTNEGKPVTDVVYKADTRLTAEQVKSTRVSGANYNDFFKVAPGTYNARFVVRDLLSGRIGSIIAPITVAK